MAIQVSGTQVIGNSRELTNIASVDATTAASIQAAGVGGASGEQNFVAAEAITAGNVLGLNSVGKVANRGVILGANTQTYNNNQNEKVFYGTWDPDNEFFIYGIGYYGDSSTRRIGYVVGQVNSDKSISAASARLTTPGNYSKNLGMAYDTNANKVVAYLFDNGSNTAKVVVGTVNSNKTISWGSLTSTPFGAEAYYCMGMCFDPSTNKCVFVGSSGPYTFDVRACVGTVSGTSISFGSVTAAGGSNAAQNERVAIHVPGANKNVVLWQEARNNKFNIIARSTTISGTSLSFGSEGVITPTGNFEQDGMAVVADPTSGSSKFLVVNWDSNLGTMYAIVGTLSGTSITFGTPYALFQTSDFEVTGETSTSVKGKSASLALVPNTNSIVLGIQVFSSQFRRIFTQPLTISGTTVVPGPRTEMVKTTDDAASMDQVRAFLLPDYAQNYNVMSTAVAGAVYRTTSSRSFQGLPAQFIGIAAENISSGATGAVTVLGGVNTSLSGLDVGVTYGLKKSSADLVAISDADERVGRAVSATSLYIDKGFGETN